MRLLSFLICFLFVELITALSTTSAGKEEPDTMGTILSDVQSSCESGNDVLACMKFKILQSIESIFYKSNSELEQHFEVRSYGPSEKLRSRSSFAELLEAHLRLRDITIKFPTLDTQIVVSPRKINTGELGFKLKPVSDSSRNEDEGRRTKLKRVIVPIMVLILLKAMTFVPFALGVLGLKAFNSLQLGFAAFLMSAGLAIFQICKKLAVDHHTPHVISHPHWDGRAANNASDEIHKIVYRAHV